MVHLKVWAVYLSLSEEDCCDDISRVGRESFTAIVTRA